MQRQLEPEVMDAAAEAEAYDAMDHSEPNAAFVERLVELGARGRMLDVGTGPGHIPLLVCERIPGCLVVGVDLSLEMLRLANHRRAASPHRMRVEFRHVDARHLPWPDHSFDAVFSNTILHHLKDPRPVLLEAWRVLKPGGAFLFRDLFRPPSETRVRELVALHAGGATPRQQELFAASLRAAFTPQEMEELVADLGLAGVQVVVDSDRHMSLQRPASGV